MIFVLFCLRITVILFPILHLEIYVNFMLNGSVLNLSVDTSKYKHVLSDMYPQHENMFINVAVIKYLWKPAW